MKFVTSMAIVATALLPGTSPASNIDCSESAPLLDSGFYYDIDDESPIEPAQRKRLKSFARKLSGQWIGTELTTLCNGPASKRVEKQTEYNIDAVLSVSLKGALKLEANKENDTVHAIRKVLLTPATESRPQLQRWHTLEFTDQNTLIFSEKFRAAGPRHDNPIAATAAVPAVVSNERFSRLVHEIKRVSHTDSTMQIDRKVYVFGVLVEHSSMKLRRS